jgi:hypothetical protein
MQRTVVPPMRRQQPPIGPAWALLAVVTGLFVAVMLPVVLRGAPLRDDFGLCASPRWNGSAGQVLHQLLPEQGAVRLPGRLLQVAFISGLCGKVPFGLLIVVPLLLTLGVALLLRGLLRDLGLPAPWPEVGAALWLLQPLGTEAAVWPVQLNIALGLCLALVALRAVRRGRLGWAAVATIGACSLLEQTIFALPLAAWLVAPQQQRRRAAIVIGGIVAAVLVMYLLWPGENVRTAVGLADRAGAIVAEPAWYVRFPIIGLGLYSIPMAVGWAFPVSLAVLVGGLAAGAAAGPALLDSRGAQQPRPNRTHALVFVALLVLVNVPLLTTLPHPDSPRTFTPTWLVLAAVAALAGSRVRRRRPRLAAGVAGLCAAGMLLSLALSVWVRLETADFNEASSRWLAERVPEGGVAAVCGVPRTVVTPAPNGAFALHELNEPTSEEATVLYYTGRNLKIRRVGVYWKGSCPRPPEVDLSVTFSELRRRSS